MKFKNIFNRPRVNIAVILLLSGILFFLYQQSMKVDVKNLYTMDSLIHDLLAQDSVMEGDMALLVGGHLNHFDSLTEGMTKLKILNEEIIQLLGKTNAYFPSLKALELRLKAQEKPMESFKMELSTYHNSLRYLPTLLKQVQREKSYPSALAFDVSLELLSIATQPAEFNVGKLNQLLETIEDKDRFQPIIKHLNLVLKHYFGTETSMYDFTHSGVEPAAEKLMGEYYQWFATSLKEAEKYRFLLVVFAVVLLVYIAVVLWYLKRSNEALKRSHTFLHYLQKALDEHAIVTIADKQGNITFANDNFCEASGYSKEEIRGLNHRVLNSGEHSVVFFKHLWDTIKSGKTWRGFIKNKAKDSGFYWINTTITPFLNEAGEVYQYVSVRTNVTKQIEAENRLKESRERYRILSSMVPYALGIVQNDRWVYINPAMVQLFEAVSARAVLHKPVVNLVSVADKEHVIHKLKDTYGKQVKIEKEDVKMLTLSGNVLDVELQGAPLIWEGKNAVLLVMSDITMRKKEEKRAKEYQAQLEHTQRLESLGVLAGGIAHDFNNILTSIMGNTALAMNHAHDAEKLNQDLTKVGKASERAAELCEQMLMYSGGGTFEKKPALLTELLNDVTSMVRTTLRDQVHLNVVVAPSLPAVDADIRQVQQVILNLLTNAVEAIEGLGLITVELGVMAIDESFIFDLINHQRLPKGNYVFLDVSDSGCGMDSATLDKIFEPFFTTKFTGRGLGMSALLGIINAHHGAISIQSREGEGTNVRVFFPVSKDAVADLKAEPAVFFEVKARSLILVIDDEPDILEFVDAVLTDVGFQVITAADGQEGVEKFKENADKLSAVVCDMVMPKLGGIEVAKYIHEHAPQVPVLLSSGYDKDSLTELNDECISGFIHKPYMPNVLIQEVCLVVEGKSKV